MDEHLDGLHGHVHGVVKRLKMGDTGSIPVTKEYPADEIRLYATAYGMHKKKWFVTSYDKATNTVIAKRTMPPNFDAPDMIDPEEEL
jgi:hypothetical protein